MVMTGICSDGRPVGTSARTGAPPNRVRASTVPTTSAISGDGTMRPIACGVKRTIASDTAPTMAASATGACNRAGKWSNAASGPPAGLAWPRNGATCRMMMMKPMPLMKPEITGNGIRLTNRPSFSTPNRICSRPPSMTTVKAIAGLPAYWVTIAAMTTVMGPVGPEICDGVPPNTEAKNPMAMAPYRPAMGPAPDATPKASASGSATTAAVRPP